MVGFFVKCNENTFPQGTHANVESCPYNEKWIPYINTSTVAF